MVTRLGDDPVITLGDLIFNAGVADTGAQWYASLAQGWESIKPRVRTIPGEVVDGDHWQSSQKDARQLVLTGYAKLTTPSEAGLRAARDRFVAAASIFDTLANLQVIESAAQNLFVYTLDAPVVTYHGCTTIGFAVGLSAPDPRKLATTLGQLTLTETMPTVRGVTSASSGSGTSASLVLNVPLGTTTGDVMLAFFDLESAGVLTVPAGWGTVLATVDFGSHTQFYYRKLAGGSEPASYTWTLDAADDWAGVFVSVRDSDTAQAGTFWTLATTFAVPRIVWAAGGTAVPRALRVFSAGYSQVATTVTPPSDLVARANVGTSGSAPHAANYLATSQPRDDAGIETATVSASVTSGSIAVNVPPLVGPTRLIAAGTADAYPVLTVAGPTVSPMIICNHDRCVRLNVALGSTDVLEVDLKAHEVRVNSASRFDVVDPTSEWWWLTPGTNLLRSQDASAESRTTAQWTAVSGFASITRSTELSQTGTASTKFVAGSSGTLRVRSATVASVAAGTVLAATVLSQPVPNARSFDLRIVWLDSLGAVISSSTSAATSEFVGSWTVRTVSGTAPANTIGAMVEVQWTSVAVGEAHYIDRAGLYLTSVPTTYDQREANAIEYSGGGTATLTWREADL